MYTYTYFLCWPRILRILIPTTCVQEAYRLAGAPTRETRENLPPRADRCRRRDAQRGTMSSFAKLDSSSLRAVYMHKHDVVFQYSNTNTEARRLAT